MLNLKHNILLFFAKLAERCGYAMIKASELDEIRTALIATRTPTPEPQRTNTTSVTMPNVVIKEAPGVKLLSLKVWTEGPKPCAKHNYHLVKASGMHTRSSRLDGAVEHLDYVCSKCTHKVCATKWGEHV